MLFNNISKLNCFANLIKTLWKGILQVQVDVSASMIACVDVGADVGVQIANVVVERIFGHQTAQIFTKMQLKNLQIMPLTLSTLKLPENLKTLKF
jgi:catabolite regulation protein CreA